MFFYFLSLCSFYDFMKSTFLNLLDMTLSNCSFTWFTWLGHKPPSFPWWTSISMCCYKSYCCHKLHFSYWNSRSIYLWPAYSSKLLITRCAWKIVCSADVFAHMIWVNFVIYPTKKIITYMRRYLQYTSPLMLLLKRMENWAERFDSVNSHPSLLFMLEHECV